MAASLARFTPAQLLAMTLMARHQVCNPAPLLYALYSGPPEYCPVAAAAAVEGAKAKNKAKRDKLRTDKQDNLMQKSKCMRWSWTRPGHCLVMAAPLSTGTCMSTRNKLVCRCRRQPKGFLLPLPRTTHSRWCHHCHCLAPAPCAECASCPSASCPTVLGLCRAAPWPTPACCQAWWVV